MSAWFVLVLVLKRRRSWDYTPQGVNIAVDPRGMSGPSGKVAIVAGGGPVGVVAAIRLAQQGWNVQVSQGYVAVRRIVPSERLTR